MEIDDKQEEAVTKEVSTVPISDSDKFVYQILNGPNEQCLENFRMDKPVFYKLCDILQTRGLLRHTNRIKIEEQLAIFLFIIGHNLRTRAVQELFRYSGETISRHFNNVLNAVMAISTDFFQSNPNVTLEDDPRFYPHFKDCVGVVDCRHIPVMVGVDEQGPFRNKNGLLTQNVLVASSFDLRFHYVLAGWEGSASDQQVLNAALTRRSKLQVPQGILCFSSCLLFLTRCDINTTCVMQENTTLWTISTRIFQALSPRIMVFQPTQEKNQRRYSTSDTSCCIEQLTGLLEP